MKTEPMGVRFSAEERRALEQAAQNDDRKPAAMIRKIVVDRLRKTGWLKAQKEGTRA
jgi:hypothetical protein